MEVIGATRNTIAKLPHALTPDIADAEERVEVSRYTGTSRCGTLIRCWNEGTADTSKDATGTGDCKFQERQVRFKGTPAVVYVVPLTRQRTAEEDRGRMQLGVSVGPARLVGLAVKTIVFANAA